MACVVETSLSLGRLIPFSRNFFPDDRPMKHAVDPTVSVYVIPACGPLVASRTTVHGPVLASSLVNSARSSAFALAHAYDERSASALRD